MLITCLYMAKLTNENTALITCMESTTPWKTACWTTCRLELCI